jgi:GAF domain-containing protein
VQAGLNSSHVATLAARACGTALGGVSLVDPTGTRLDAAHGFGLLDPPPVATLCAQVLREGRVVVAQDLHLGEVGTHSSRNTDIRLFVGAPIVTWRGEPLGVIWAADNRPHLRSDPQVGELLMCVAEQ